MLTKERYMTSLESIADYAYSANIGPNGIDVISRDFNELKELIEEHFTPQPLKFEEIKVGMYVWDNVYESIGRVDRILTNGNCRRLHNRYSGGGDIVDYEENRYYPIQIPWEGNKKQWERTIESCKQ